MPKPKFDPTQAFESTDRVAPSQGAGAQKPAFNADQPFSSGNSQLQTSPEEAISTDIYGSDLDRTASSFGNDRGIQKMLAQRGYTDLKRNKDGEIVVKGPNGQWYKDESGFLAHPVNWTESRLGKALPLAGMMAGGIGGADLGFLAGSVPGAAAGAMGGEGLRQAGGRMMGVYDADLPESLKDVALEGASGAGAELIGKPISDAISAASGPIKEGIKKGVAKTSEFLTGVPSEAISRLIERPSQVMGADVEGNALKVAQKARQELLDRADLEGSLSSKARTQAAAKYGQVPVDTQGIQGNIGDFLGKYAPAEGIEGALSPGERAQLQEYQKMLKSGDMDQRSFSDMQKFVDQVDRKVKDFEQSKLPGSGDTRFQSYMRSLRGQSKTPLQEISPELKAADNRFSEYADNASRLGRLENEDTMEGFINNFYGKNKSIMRQAAGDVIPNSVPDIADIGASRAFTKQGPAGSEMGARRMIGSGAGLALGAHGAMTHSPGMMAAGGFAHMATSPGAHKAVIGQASKMLESPIFKMIQSNPQLIESIADPKLKSFITQMMGEQSSSMGKVAGEDRSIANDPVMPIEKAQDQFIKGN